MGHVGWTMDTHRRPPVLDMTPEGEFRDPEPTRAGGPLDRFLARLGGVAVLVAAAAGGLLLAGVALLFIGILLPVAIVAGALAAASLWWRLRRARRDGTVPQGARFEIIRR
jgi:Flp pilus assembly protein TadB